MQMYGQPNQGGIPAGFEQVAEGIFMNPRTGQMIDTQTGQTFASPDEFGSKLSQYEAPSQAKEPANQGSTAAGIGSALGGAGLYGMGGSGSAGATGTALAGSVPATPTIVGSQGVSGVGTAMNGGTMMADGTIVGGSGNGLLATAPGSMGAGFLPAAGVAAGALTGGLQAKGLYDAAKGDSMNFASQAALALPTFGLSFAYNPIKKMFGSKKAGERKARQAGRNNAEDAGLIEDGKYSLADGSGFDIAEFRKNTGKQAFDIDWAANDPERDVKVGAVNSLAAALAGKDQKLRSDLAGELYNAYGSSGDFWNNIKTAADKKGGANAWAGALQNNKGLKDTDRAVFMSGLDSIYNVDSRNKIQASVGGKAPSATKPMVQVKKPINPRLKGAR